MQIIKECTNSYEWGNMFTLYQAKEKFIEIGLCEMLEPIFFGPFHIIQRMGPVAYILSLPPKVKAHHVFDIFLVKQYVHMLIMSLIGM